MTDLRVGIGVDAHALEAGVPLVLGGVSIDHPRGLAGHSDGDVVAHALIDAILGAANLGDIGSLFPSGDEQYTGRRRSISCGRRTAGARGRLGARERDCVLIGEEPGSATCATRWASGRKLGRVLRGPCTLRRPTARPRGEGLAARACPSRPMNVVRYADRPDLMERATRSLTLRPSGYMNNTSRESPGSPARTFGLQVALVDGDDLLAEAPPFRCPGAARSRTCRRLDEGFTRGMISDRPHTALMAIAISVAPSQQGGSSRAA